MATAHAEPRLSPEQLLHAVDLMSADEIASFARRVIELRARRVAPLLSSDESPVLERINRALPSSRQARYEALLARRDDHALSEAEHDELVALSDEFEALDADRIVAVSELAQLRGVSLRQMLATLSPPVTDP